VFKYQRDIEEAKNIISRFEESKAEYDSNKDMLETQITELDKELKDYEIVQKNSLNDLDKVKNELSDLNYNVTLAYRKVTQLEANKKAVEEASLEEQLIRL
jgi:predicted  nucleic acid-binding Zn-ribbon protein